MEWDKLKVSQDLETVKNAIQQDSALMDLNLKAGESKVNQVYPESTYQELGFQALVQEEWDLIQELIKVHSERPENRDHIQGFQVQEH